MGVPGGRHHASRIHVEIPSVLQATSYAAPAKKSALWQSGCTKVLDFGRSNPFPLLRCWTLHRCGIAAAFSVADYKESQILSSALVRADDRAASNDGRLRLDKLNRRNAVAAARPAKAALDHDAFSGSNYNSLRRGSGAAAVADGPGRS